MFLEMATMERKKRGMRILIYGEPKIGKSYFGAQIDGHIFMNLENGLEHLDHCMKTPLLRSYPECKAFIKELITQPHNFTTLVIDTIDVLETLIRKWVAEQQNNTNIHDIVDIPYGKGYELLLVETRNLLTGLEKLVDKGMNIVFISHDEIKQKTLPDGTSFNYHAPSLFARTGKGDSTLKIYNDYMDIIARCAFRLLTKEVGTGFTKQTVARGNGDRIMYMEAGDPAYIGGSRYPLPGQIPFDWSALCAAMEKAGAPTQKNPTDIPDDENETEE